MCPILASPTLLRASLLWVPGSWGWGNRKRACPCCLCRDSCSECWFSCCQHDAQVNIPASLASFHNCFGHGKRNSVKMASCTSSPCWHLETAWPPCPMCLPRSLGSVPLSADIDLQGRGLWERQQRPSLCRDFAALADLSMGSSL